MKWFNMSTDSLPSHGQTTLISVNGIYHITVYDSENKLFTLVSDSEVTFSVLKHQIYWRDYKIPEEK
ncbi:MAG: hypothetical protein K0S32_2107 [Bacteroidetes bacterium]|jgi:hypothetical protein|nr:hypothetical protein [Bacteroidota bacterium]